MSDLLQNAKFWAEQYKQAKKDGTLVCDLKATSDEQGVVETELGGTGFAVANTICNIIHAYVKKNPQEAKIFCENIRVGTGDLKLYEPIFMESFFPKQGGVS